MSDLTGVRENILAQGSEARSDRDLLATVVGGSPADALLVKFGNLSDLRGRAAGELAVKGLGSKGVAVLMAALELGRRAAIKPSASTILQSAIDVAAECDDMATQVTERFEAIAVNSRNRITGRWTIATGWETGVNLTPRMVFSRLLREDAYRVVFVHNHPSGDPAPSSEDLRFTTALLNAGKAVGVSILDHVIVASEGFASIRESSNIPFNQ